MRSDSLCLRIAGSRDPPSFSIGMNSRSWKRWPGSCQWSPTGHLVFGSMMLARCSSNLKYASLVVNPAYCFLHPGLIQVRMYLMRVFTSDDFLDLDDFSRVMNSDLLDNGSSVWSSSSEWTEATLFSSSFTAPKSHHCCSCWILFQWSRYFGSDKLFSQVLTSPQASHWRGWKWLLQSLIRVQHNFPVFD